MATDAAASPRPQPLPTLAAARDDSAPGPGDAQHVERVEAAVLLAVRSLTDRSRDANRRLREQRPEHRPYRWDDLVRLVPGLSRGTPASARVLAQARCDAEHLVARAAESGIEAVPFSSSRYPSLLRELVDAPPVLWLRGQPTVMLRPCIAVVGARAASATALETARQLGADLARTGVVVVSGLARGVDAAAHVGALETGMTAAVLGGGLDRIYPAEHRPLAERVSANGAVITEFTPGTPALPAHFPQRNRIVAGLCMGVVVVEAGETSGSLITARHALEGGREVMVVPGAALPGRNRGGHSLIKDGAALVESARDVIDLLRGSSWRSHLGGIGPAAAGTSPPGAEAPPAQWRVGEELDLDDLSALFGPQPSMLLGRLMEWELAGIVGRTPGGRFVRLGG